MIGLSKNVYKIGDIVYLKSSVLAADPTLFKHLENPFVIVELPLDTKKFKTYTLRQLDPNAKDGWDSYYLHQDFFDKRDSNA
jgi:hypothetical protein